MVVGFDFEDHKKYFSRTRDIVDSLSLSALLFTVYMSSLMQLREPSALCLLLVQYEFHIKI